MSHADTTYSFFSSCDLVMIPNVSPKVISKSESYMDSMRGQEASHTHAVEDWIVATSYGYFSSPSLNPEPVHKVPQTIERLPELKIKPVDYDGYSFFAM